MVENKPVQTSDGRVPQTCSRWWCSPHAVIWTIDWSEASQPSRNDLSASVAKCMEMPSRTYYLFACASSSGKRVTFLVDTSSRSRTRSPLMSVFSSTAYTTVHKVSQTTKCIYMYIQAHGTHNKQNIKPNPKYATKPTTTTYRRPWTSAVDLLRLNL